MQNFICFEPTCMENLLKTLTYTLVQQHFWNLKHTQIPVSVRYLFHKHFGNRTRPNKWGKKKKGRKRMVL